MGGRGYHNDVNGYLNSNRRTAEYARISEMSNDKIDFIKDVVGSTPVAPEFSNSANKIYVLLNNEETKIKNITVYDENHEQKYSIHLDHNHKGKSIHVHSGLNSGRHDIPLTDEHNHIVSLVQGIFRKWRK